MTDNRTEKPTPRRLKEARQKGQGYTRSQEVGVAFSLIASFVALRTLGPGVVADFRYGMVNLFAASVAANPLEIAGQQALRLLALGSLPFLAVAFVAGIGAGIAQTGIVFNIPAAKPKLSNLNPKRGLDKLKPTRAAWELARSALKLALLVAVAWAPVAAWVGEMGAGRSLNEGMRMTMEQAMALMGRVGLAAIAIAVADYAITRHRTQKSLKMSKSDVKRDMRDSEGDPMLKARRQRLALDVSRNRMIFEVGRADVVVANPTHVAVALRYVPSDPAPRVVARGMGKMARRIKAEARRNGVHVTEDRPLARALYRHGKVGQLVPSPLYEAVAVILATVYRLRRKGA